MLIAKIIHLFSPDHAQTFMTLNNSFHHLSLRNLDALLFLSQILQTAFTIDLCLLGFGLTDY